MTGSRKLSVAEYLKVLQLEYLSHKTREFVYEDPGFIKMNREIAGKKKEKILNLSKKFQLLSIFDSKHYFEEFVNTVFFQEFGLPSLQYSIDADKAKAVAYWDKYFLLKPHVIVEYNNQDYLVVENFPNKDILEINYGKEILTLPYTWIKIKRLNIPFE